MLEGTILVNKYLIKKLLGSGGAGEVYLAERIGIGGDVAIKLIRSDMPQASLAKEAKILAGLQHPNICQFIDFVEHEDSSFIVMEYLYGTDLSHFLRHNVYNKEIELDIVIFIFRSILEALSFAHEKEILHRDIKPANIFITNHQQVKLLDFGISRRIEDGALTTSAMQFTPLYSSPELFINKTYDPSNYSVQNDFYSLALVIYELITKKKAYSSFEDLQQGMIDFDCFKNDYSLIEPILKKMLDKVPEARYQNAKSILRDIEACLGERFNKTPRAILPQDSFTNESVEKTISFKKKENKKIILSLILTLLILVGIWLGFKNKDQPNSPKKENLSQVKKVFKSNIEFLIEDNIFTFSSSSLNLAIGLGPVQKWTISKDRIACSQGSTEYSCHASILRDGNLEIIFTVSNGKINRITFNVDKVADKELKKLIDQFLKLGEALPEKIIGGISFKAARLNKQVLTYQHFPLTTMAIFELDSEN